MNIKLKLISDTVLGIVFFNLTKLYDFGKLFVISIGGKL